MSAIVIDFSSARARFGARSVSRSRVAAAPSVSHDFTFWRGATGSRYVHTVYPLLDCPELPNANVILVRRHAGGQADVIHIGSVEHGVGCSNLAEIRLIAAKLGANEVHVHLLAANLDERAKIVHDLAEAGDANASELAAAARH